MKILLIEDDQTLQVMVKTVLESNNNIVTVAPNGNAGIESIKTHDFDCVMLDMGLPDMDGMTVLKEIRELNTNIPIIIVTARDGVDNKVKGLYSGADDYLVKPFDFKELIARIDAVVRRKSSSSNISETIYCKDIKVDLLSREVFVSNKQISLTNNEFKLLLYLMQNKDKLITREELSQEVWSIDFDTRTNFVNVYISYLRKKIREFSDYEYIETIRGEGFRFNSDPD